MRNLKDALQAVSERGTHVGSGRLRERVAVELAGGGSRSWSTRFGIGPAWALAGAFVAAILVIGIPILLLRGEGIGTPGLAGPPAASPATTTAPSTTVAPPTTTTTMATTTTLPDPADGLAMHWQRVESDVLGGGGIETLGVGGPGFIAAGGSDVWVSEDGSDWQRAAPDVFGSSDQISDVAVGSDGLLVAVGASGETPAVWTSSDGLDWIRVADVDGVFDVTGKLIEVAAGDDGWVAAAQHQVEGWSGPTGTFLGIWHSTDGVAWEQVGFEGDPDWKDAHITEMLFWDGSFYAVGYRERLDVDSEGNPVTVAMMARTSVWSSADGRTWTWLHATRDTGNVELPEGIPEWGAWAEGAVATEAGIVAGGVVMNWTLPPDDWSLGIWRTNDGITWSLLPTEFTAPGRDTHGSEIKPLAGTDERMIAIELSNYVWASKDRGETWSQVAVLEAAAECDESIVWALAFDGTRFIAAGWSCEDAAIWVGEWVDE